jgi:lactoylglutathione lyase
VRHLRRLVLDPAGNNIEVVYHGAAKRSADSVKIEFEM